MKWPYARVEFNKAGVAAEPKQVTQALDVIRGMGSGQTDPPHDVLIVAHGWNNGRDAAEQLFAELGDNIALLAERENVSPGQFAIIGLQWPAIRWAEEDQIAGGGVSVGDEQVALEAAIREGVDDARVAAELVALAGQLEVSTVARAAFIGRLRTLIPTDTTTDDDPVSDAFLRGDPEALFIHPAEAERDIDELGLGTYTTDPASDLPPGLFPNPLNDGAATDAVGLNLEFADPRRMARRLLNYTTYYTMKERSRTVGEKGLLPLLDQIVDAARPAGVRLHLVGHSFGARLVTSAAALSPHSIASLSLLQAAFSHRAFSSTLIPPGAFRSVLAGPLAGPCIVTHTHNDKAVLLAYAVASRVAGQVSAGVGDPNDPYGGLGANGAIATDEADEGTLESAAHNYTFTRGRIQNLLADAHIAHHGDVRNPEVANAVLQAALAARVS